MVEIVKPKGEKEKSKERKQFTARVPLKKGCLLILQIKYQVPQKNMHSRNRVNWLSLKLCMSKNV